VEGVASALVSAGTGIMGVMPSPLTGASGNVEFLLHARKGSGEGAGPGRNASSSGSLASLVAGAVAEAEERLSAANPAG
jgi:hypothetical protein